MTENNAAQPGLTDDEIIKHLEAAGVSFMWVEGRSFIHTTAGSQRVDTLLSGIRALLSKLRAEGVQAGDERISDETLWSWATQTMGGKEAHHVGMDRVLRYARLLLSSTTARNARAWEVIDDAMGKTYITESLNLVTTLSKEPDVKINPLAYAALASAPVAGEAKPVATLHDDGYYTWHGAKPQGYEQAGWRMKVYAAPQSSEAVPVGIINAARYAGFTFLRHADGSYTLQPIVMATSQVDKDGGDCAK